jgi:hypothetical protein
MQQRNQKNNRVNKTRNNTNGRQRMLTVRIPKPIGFPDRYATQLQYSDAVSINPSATVGQYTFRGNSLYDPDYTSAGHQPRYFDQLAAVYTKYRVLACTLSVTAVTATATSAQIVIIPNTDVVTFSTVYDALEHPRAIALRLIGTSGVMAAKRTTRMRTSTILGLSKMQSQDNDYAALVTANPSQMWYFILFASEPGGGNVHIVTSVTLTYECEFFDRGDVTSS